MRQNIWTIGELRVTRAGTLRSHTAFRLFRHRDWRASFLRPFRPGWPLVHSAALPKLRCCIKRIDACLLPPRCLVAHAVNQPVVNAAEGDGELIADLASEGPGLREAQVMRVGGFAAADKTGLLRDEPQVVLVS